MLRDGLEPGPAAKRDEKVQEIQQPHRVGKGWGGVANLRSEKPGR